MKLKKHGSRSANPGVGRVAKKLLSWEIILLMFVAIMCVSGLLLILLESAAAPGYVIVQDAEHFRPSSANAQELYDDQAVDSVDEGVYQNVDEDDAINFKGKDVLELELGDVVAEEEPQDIGFVDQEDRSGAPQRAEDAGFDAPLPANDDLSGDGIKAPLPVGANVAGAGEGSEQTAGALEEPNVDIVNEEPHVAEGSDKDTLEEDANGSNAAGVRRSGETADKGKKAHSGSQTLAEEKVTSVDASLSKNATLNEYSESAECGPGPAKSWLMGFVGHSGSSAIVSTIMSHSSIMGMSDMEPVDKFTNQQYEYDRARLRTVEIFDEGMRRELIPGFKLRYSSVRYQIDDWVKLVKKYNTRFIAEYRLNHLEAASGIYLIRIHGNTGPQQGLQAGEKGCGEGMVCTARIDDFDLFARLFNVVRLGAENVKDYMTKVVPWKCVLHVTYEDYLMDNAGTMNRIWDFLGVPRENHSPKYHKALPSGVCHVIENYQELCHNFWACKNVQPWLENEASGCVCESKPETPPNATLCHLTEGAARGIPW